MPSISRDVFLVFYSSLSISSSCRLYSAGKHRISRSSVFLCFPTYPNLPALLCPRARAPLISKEGQTGLGMNRTKMAEMVDRSANHHLTTRNHLHSLISQDTSLYLCTGGYIKTYAKLFIHRKWKYDKWKQGDSFP